jgi:hypothetical protein
MMKITMKRVVIPVSTLGITVLLTIATKTADASFVGNSNLGGSMTVALRAPASLMMAHPAVPATVAPKVDDIVLGDPAVLDLHRRLALGMIETGNRDDEIGGAGEVSRYQIMPSVWRQFSQSANYRNPDVSLEVAQKYWTRLYGRFVQQAHRKPTDFDMYVLWNTHYGYYASHGFNPDRLSATVRDRAQRYVNLVECNDI